MGFTRSKVNAGAQPWKGAFDQMMASKYADLNRTPGPRAVVERGSYSNPHHGCTDEREDAIAAYTHALAWYLTRDERHARKAIELRPSPTATTPRDGPTDRAPGGDPGAPCAHGPARVRVPSKCAPESCPAHGSRPFRP